MSAVFGRGASVGRDGDPPPRPHEQVQAFLDSSGPSPDPWSADIAIVRADAREKVLAVTGEPVPVASVESIDADGVPGRLYRPTGGEREVLVWAHGGGWMHGDLDTADGVARALANRAACAVLSIDYRLAPEHPFPAGFDDAWTAITWARRNFDSVAVGGDSSGGNLAAAAALKARDEGVELAAQLLVYPVLDSTEDTDYKIAFQQRYARFAGRPGFGSNSYRRLEHIWETYVPDPSARKASYASPLHAESVYGVAPATIITAEHDFLRGEAEDYARRLRSAGVPVELHEYAGQIHGFFEMFAVMTDAHHAVGVAGDAVRRAFQSSHPNEPSKEFSCDH
ncbi:acetyl esterase [Kribbella sp. VKM Ac-2527]|uniref:Acetyl esterase n=1 Tax=Kribbella caucasensis TaxID=2512215 RepID=A0A4R6KAI3_9ACTN|nr:alpha/beta hydrolase [Kribbella sp. VKM Ac-2527]TDO46815.1 acetyl esterase [Kribbella sp. VKM Ac-2527]